MSINRNKNRKERLSKLLCQSVMRAGSKDSVIWKLQSLYLDPILLSLRNVTNTSGRVHERNSIERLVLNRRIRGYS